MITSPIFYMGNKKKLIEKGLINMFPQNIDTFVDLFGGSGVVSMNTNANNYFINDKNKNIIELFEMFNSYDSNEIITQLEYLINKYELEKGKTDKISFDNRSKYYNEDLANIHKENYIRLRNEYNKTREPILMYCLLIYCFCHQMRFNSNNEFNMPCGNGIFTEENKQWIKDSDDFFNKKLTFTNNDFRELSANKLTNNDFVYLDPPYLNTTATYNENGGWTEKDENDLYKLCEELNINKVKFAMSNVFENKCIKNNKLIQWCNNNNWNIHYFDDFTYSACGKGNSNTIEVLIMNY